jgi:1-deoxy-D-xylulose 5-phosphate reductoisomerase
MVQEVGWSAKTNGELLHLAETAFDVFVTVDANLQFQQNSAGRKIAVGSASCWRKSLGRLEAALSFECGGR